MEVRLAFLMSSPRSGSTMLARMLAAHTRIYCRPEPQLIAPLHQLGYYGIVEHPGEVPAQGRLPAPKERLERRGVAPLPGQQQRLVARLLHRTHPSRPLYPGPHAEVQSEPD